MGSKLSYALDIGPEEWFLRFFRCNRFEILSLTYFDFAHCLYLFWVVVYGWTWGPNSLELSKVYWNFNEAELRVFSREVTASDSFSGLYFICLFLVILSDILSPICYFDLVIGVKFTLISFFAWQLFNGNGICIEHCLVLLKSII